MKLEVVNKSPFALPRYETAGSVGMDLKADVDQLVLINPGETIAIPTGIYVQVPEGFELQIRSRSGMSLKRQLVVANSPGTIDQDFRGEIKVIIHNQSGDLKPIKKGDRVAQMVLCPIEKVEWVEVVNLSATKRGEEGFGSTGV